MTLWGNFGVFWGEKGVPDSDRKSPKQNDGEHEKASLIFFSVCCITARTNSLNCTQTKLLKNATDVLCHRAIVYICSGYALNYPTLGNLFSSPCQTS